ncbi:MAG: hypothetical protein ONB23_13045 [candidate division KSB1 bacterium]|nr:hypothetical protein [candidate division KSB1 bacterium]
MRFWAVVPLLMITSAAASQEARVLGVHVEYRDPKGTSAGLAAGVSYGYRADESVDLAIGVDYFRKVYSQVTQVAEEDFPGGITERTVSKKLEYRTVIVPLYGMITIRIPLTYSVFAYLRGGVGYELLFNREQNYELGVEERRTYHGMGWRFGVGAAMRLGRRSVLEAGLLYHSAEVEREKKDSRKGLPVWKTVDLSGLGAAVGIRIETR